MATVPSTSADGARAGSPGKQPRTARGRATLRRLLDAAALEFAERGFHEASISGITRRAGTALGSFYTYFDSKDAIFSALVKDMSKAVADKAAAAVSPDSSARKAFASSWSNSRAPRSSTFQPARLRNWNSGRRAAPSRSSGLSNQCPTVSRATGAFSSTSRSMAPSLSTFIAA